MAEEVVSFLLSRIASLLDEKKYVETLERAAIDGNWKIAKAILDKRPHLKTERIQRQGMTALLLAAQCGKSEFVVELVNILNADDLEMMVDNDRSNALHHAAMASDVRAARAIVQKNSKLAQSKNAQNFTPLFYAARRRHPSKGKEMLEFLFEKTHPDARVDDDTAPGLVFAITASGYHGMALKILKYHEKLALEKEHKWSILHMLATQPSAFSGGRKTSLLCRWMNSQATMRQKDAVELVHFVCQQLLISSKIDVITYFFPDDFDHAILNLATVHGASELVKVCLKYFPDLIFTSKDKRSLLHVAVEHRREEIYNLVRRLVGPNADSFVQVRDENENNILHLAAKLASAHEFPSVPGPAFELQLELQWFKAVESIVYAEQKVQRNIHGFTPVELFFKEHVTLITDAKGWMRDTSNSCMVVAALVATVAFASMITVPGGNNNETGMPFLYKKKAFVVFSVTNALSMMSSAFALLRILSLQMSRFTEEDVLESLPKHLLQILLSTFVAVATMMIAFGTAIGMAFQRVKWAYIPITVVGCIVAIIFTRLHYPLLVQALVVKPGPVII